MAGPFTSYAPPDVYTRTLYEPAVASLLGGLRIPVLIGVADEFICVEDLEIFRGSSSTNDVPVAREDISHYFDGSTSGPAKTRYFPIVKGDGKGRVTNDPRDVKVEINGQPVAVRQVRGATGEIWLVDIPRDTDDVRISYFFNRADSLITDEDLSYQVTGTNVKFKTQNVPVVLGNNGGVTTTDPSRITVTVDGTPAAVITLDGASGFFSLSVAPSIGQKVKVTYYTNQWQDTFDLLPNENIASVERVGLGPGRIDFVEGVDYVIVDDQVHWGASYRIESKVHTFGTEYFDTTQVAFTLRDNHRFLEEVGVGDGVNKEFYTEYRPTDGSGRNRVGIFVVDKVTDDVSKIQVYVGSNAQDALAHGTVTVMYLEGESKRITLKNPPAPGQIVYVTHYENMLRDDCYDVVNVLEGTSGNGMYKIVSQKSGDLAHVYEGIHSVADPDFAIEGIHWPDGSVPDLQPIPGYAVDELVTVTMGDNQTFAVTSSNPLGSFGTGNVNQTYKDRRTGLRFTVFSGVAYTFEPGDVLRFHCDFTPVVTSPLPNTAVPGGWTFVFNTAGVGVGDSAELCTFVNSGNEPDIGDFYYISYCYAKTDYNTHIYTRFSEVEANYGKLTPENRLVVAAWLCFLNGAAAVGLLQVKKEPNLPSAAPTSYIEAIQTLEKPIEGKIKPDVIVPITTELDVIDALRFHVIKMSNIRYQGERIGIYGLPVGTAPFRAQEIAQSMQCLRVVQMYPDGAIMGLLDELGFEVQFQVDGSFLAAAFAGLNVGPQYDVATPMTNKQIIGFKRLNRVLDDVEMNQTAAAGVTIVQDTDPVMLIRHSLTTDMTNVLTRELSITTIADYVQQVARHNLRQYIGRKYLNRLNSDITATLGAALELLKQAEIITDFTGITTTTDPVDPTIARVEAYYRPMFPLNWIVVTFNLRTVL